MGSEDPGPAAALRGARRAAAAISPYALMRLYLAHHLRTPPAPFHRELLEGASARVGVPGLPGLRLAAGLPAGYGKSTVFGLALPLWALASGRARFAVVLAAGAGPAAERAEALLVELTGNPRLLAEFPHLRAVSAAGRPVRTVRLAGGAALAVGHRLAAIASLRHLGRGPDLVVCDDVEAEGDPSSARRRAATASWFRNSVLGPLPPAASLVVAGTLRHPADLLAGLLGDPPQGWAARRLGAVSAYPRNIRLWIRHERVSQGLEAFEGAAGPAAAAALLASDRARMLAGSAALWPAREGVAELMATRAAAGWVAFDTRMQNLPPGAPQRSNMVLDLDGRDLSTRPRYEWPDSSGLARVSESMDPAAARLWDNPPMPAAAGTGRMRIVTGDVVEPVWNEAC